MFSFPPYFEEEVMAIVSFLPVLAIAPFFNPSPGTVALGLVQVFALLGGMGVLWWETRDVRWGLRIPCLLAGYVLCNLALAMFAAFFFQPSDAFVPLFPFLLNPTFVALVVFGALLTAAKRRTPRREARLRL